MKSDLQGKRLIILGGAPQCYRMVEYAHNAGVFTIVVDRNEKCAAAGIADEMLNCSVTDAETILKYCESNPVDGIMNFNVDNAQHAHYAVTKALGLPNYGPETAYQVLTDKRLFKQYCLKYGVDVIPEYSIENKQEIQYPVFVKPAESAGSSGSTICFSEQELEAAVKQAEAVSTNGKIIIEKYMMNKPEFMVAYVIVDGTPYVNRTGDRYLGPESEGLNRVCLLSISPSKFSDFYMREIDEKVKKLLLALGIKNGTVFLQGFVDEGTIRFFDPAIRLPGGNYDIIMQNATGIDLKGMLLEYALKGKMTVHDPALLAESYRLNGKYEGAYMPLLKPGKIAEISGFEKINSIPNAMNTSVKKDVGDIVNRTGTTAQRLAEFVFLTDSIEEIYAIVGRINSMIDAADDEGNDMCIKMAVGPVKE